MIPDPPESVADGYADRRWSLGRVTFISHRASTSLPAEKKENGRTVPRDSLGNVVSFEPQPKRSFKLMSQRRAAATQRVPNTHRDRRSQYWMEIDVRDDRE